MTDFIEQNKKFFPTIALFLLMALTRTSHFGSAISLPDATLAIFYLLGLFSGGLISISILMAEAGLIDYLAITQAGVSDYCISPAYAFLVPTYLAMYAAGHLSKRYPILKIEHIAKQIGYLLLATSFAFLISNGSFYGLSGKFPNLSIAEYASRVVQYYPAYLSSTLAYGISLLVAIKIMRNINLAKLKTA